MSRNNSTVGSLIGSLIGLIVFVGFGAFFLLRLSPFTFFRIMPFFPMIFIIIIIGIAGAASARSRRAKHSTCCSPKSNNQYQYYTTDVPRSNPYIVKASSSSTVRPIYIDDVEPEKPKANFCQFCGTKKDRNAIYCHSCGTKLE